MEIVSAPNLLRELWWGLRLRLSTKTRLALKYFRATSLGGGSVPEIKTVYAEDINGDEIHRLLTDIRPDLIVVWFSAILKPRLLNTAKHVINFHTGILPFYRGAVANQFATLRHDAAHIGSTIHFVTPGVDRGDIIAQVYGDVGKPPREMFRELNDKSLTFFIDIAQKLYAGEPVPSSAQDQSEGEFFRLSQWSNELRWKVGRQLLQWEETGIF